MVVARPRYGRRQKTAAEDDEAEAVISIGTVAVSAPSPVRPGHNAWGPS